MSKEITIEPLSNGNERADNVNRLCLQGLMNQWSVKAEQQPGNCV